MNKRPLSQIAWEIKKYWPKPYFGADPYLAAMLDIDSTSKKYVYLCEPAEYIVNGFLSNCSNWRGPEARALKDELKAWVS